MSYLRILQPYPRSTGSIGSGTLYLARIKGRPIKIRANDLVGPLSGMSYPAGHLFHVELSSANAVQREDLCSHSHQFPPHKRRRSAAARPHVGLYTGKNQSSARLSDTACLS